MTPQRIFDHIVSHLRGMESRAGTQYDDHFQCSYLDDKNRMCAVGSLFPLIDVPKEIMTKMQGFYGCAMDLSKDFKSYLPEWFKDNGHMLEDLQVVHDKDEHWGENGFNYSGEICLKMTANHYGLVYTPK